MKNQSKKLHNKIARAIKKYFEGFSWHAFLNYCILMVFFVFGVVRNSTMFEMLLMIVYALCLWSYATMGAKKRMTQIRLFRSNMSIFQCSLMEMSFYLGPIFAFLLNKSYFTLGLYSAMLFIFTMVCKSQVSVIGVKKRNGNKN